MAKPAIRLQAIQFTFVIGLIVLVARAAQVQLLEGERHELNARAQRTERVELIARRGTIYDRNGVPLAVTEYVYHVGVAPEQLVRPEQDAEVIANRLGLSTSRVRRLLRRSWAYIPGPFNSAQVQPLRRVRGVHLDSALTRFHPNGRLARPLLGMPGAPGRPASGIERSFDSMLRGENGSAVVLRDQFGQRYQSPARLDSFPVPGHDIYLTIDAALQDLVEQALGEAVDRYDASGGDVVVVDPATGELLALASLGANGSASPNVFTSAFEPGSTAKLFTAAALLTGGLVESNEIVWGEGGSYKIGSRTINDSESEGWMTLRQVIKRSSNVGIAKFSERLSREQQYLMLRDFGLGTPTGVEFPAESPGVLRRPDRWSGTSSVSLAMGYEVAVTMLQLTQAYSAIANDGILLRPTVIRSIRDRNGREAYGHTPEPVRRVVGSEVAAELRAMLEDVVDDGGTGDTVAFLRYKVAGKTGTARRAGRDGYVAGAYTASFASLFPAEDPQLVMVVKLDDPEGGYARLSAAPLTRSMLGQLLAAETSALDFARLDGESATYPPPAPNHIDGSVPYVVSWPAEPAVRPGSARSVPDVRGLSMREAARRLHDRGLRARLDGWGTVSEVEPAPGTSVEAGALVTMTAELVRRQQ